MRTKTTIASLTLCALPLLAGAQGDGCAANSRTPAPDVTGWWDVTYDDRLDVEITIGGSVYTSEIGAQGGVIQITHEGRPLTFDLDCDRPEILCPSEAWPTQVLAEQREASFEHRMIVTLPVQSCSVPLTAPAPGSCGNGTNNPDCDDVCNGDIITRNEERFGVIGESGDTFRLYLGAGLATNGINCALIGWSVADAVLENVGTRNEADWESVAMNAGVVEVGYSGGCLWAGDPDMDGDLEALVLGATVKFTTGFVADKR
jgi:hypothetical protein